MSIITALQRLAARLRNIPGRAWLDAGSRRFIAHNRKTWAGWKPVQSDGEILIDYHPIFETLVSYSYFANVLAKKTHARIMTFSSRPAWLYPALQKIYRSFNTAGHVVIALSDKQLRRRDELFATAVSAIFSKRDLFELSVLGQNIGVDIYESYLKDFNQPTVQIGDPRLHGLIRKAIGILVFWSDYFEQHPVRAIVVSHDSYVTMNIICRVAYAKGVPVYLPNLRGITKSDQPYAIYQNFRDYRRMFARLSAEEQAAGKALAKQQLDRRLGGEVGVDMAYSTRSAFGRGHTSAPLLRSGTRPKVIICTHCFYDNPHAYGGLLFTDFHEWLTFLVDVAGRTDYDWYLKMHPDPLPGTAEVVESIVGKSGRITVLPFGASHHQLAAEGIGYALTAYGSIGHEYPLLGVQVINAGYNPHIAYDFNWHPGSREEYERFLLNIGAEGKPMDKPINVDEVHEFYFMHYYYAMADDLVMDSYRGLVRALPAQQRMSSKVFDYFLDSWSDARHGKTLDAMRQFIDSGKRVFLSRGPE
jgi:hypothetical protein